MSPNRPPNPGASEPVDEATVAGLARDLHELRRTVEPLIGLDDRLDDLAGIVTDLGGKVAALTARKGPTPCPSWLCAPRDPHVVMGLLDGLRAWMEAVYLRYSDAAASLPECWCWHPDVVEELVCLMHGWLAAYQGPAAAVGLAADWHDRYRPGVVRRIKQVAGSCSRERHQLRPGWESAPSSAPVVPAADATEAIATWWAMRRDQPAPEPAARPDPWAVSP
jgi:hypothetical protein